MNKSQFVREAVLNCPLIIPNILKDPSFDPRITKGIIHDMLPYRTSFEIECTDSLFCSDNPVLNAIHNGKNSKQIANIYHITSFSADSYFSEPASRDGYNEHRISFNCHQLSGFYNILIDMKKGCKINSASGIHIHVDAIALKHVLVDFLFTNNLINQKKRYLSCQFDIGDLYDKVYHIGFPFDNKLRSIGKNYVDEVYQLLGNNYEGKYVKKGFGIFSKDFWYNLREYTFEFRIAPQTFEYETLIKWAIGCNSIVKKFTNDVRNFLKTQHS